MQSLMAFLYYKAFWQALEQMTYNPDDCELSIYYRTSLLILEVTEDSQL